jgi:hypothetical protein
MLDLYSAKRRFPRNFRCLFMEIKLTHEYRRLSIACAAADAAHTSD